LTDVINHNGSSELLIHFKWYGIAAQSTALFKHTHVHYTHSNGMELLHNLQHCSNTLTYTIRTHALTIQRTHTHYTPAVAVSGTFWAPWQLHFAVWRKTSSCWRFSIAASLRQGALGQTFDRVEKEWARSDRGTSTIGQTKYSASFIQSCQATNYPCKVLKNFDDSMLRVKHTLVRRSGGI